MNVIDEAGLLPLVAELTLEEKVALLTGKDSWSLTAIEKIGLRSMVVSDGPVGVRGRTWDERSPSINFPSPTAMAAGWNPSRIREIGAGLGAEARRKSVDVVLAPTINIHRTPYGGRHFEAFSEDPVLTADIAAAYVAGIQGQGIGATVKHYVANDSETDRFTVDVRVDERTLREVYLLAFEKPITEAGSWLVMSAYNSINGVTATENDLLSTPLNDEWAFDGVVISDWTAVRSTDSANHPQDLAMPGPSGAWGDALVAAVRDGRVDEAHLDRKIVRILRLAARVGALQGHEPAPRETPPPTDLRPLVRRAAADGMVLLRNEAALPLVAPTSIAVIGEGARAARTQGGGSATVVVESVVSPVEGITARWPGADVAWSLGAVVQSGIAPLPSGASRTEAGGPGMLVRYLDEDGGERGREHRRSSSIVSFDGATAATRAASIEFSLLYTPGEDRRLGISGLADFEVKTNGAVIASGQLRTQPGDDPATAVLNPPFTAVDLPDAEGGGELALTVTFTPVEGGIPDAIALGIGLPPATADADALIAEAVASACASEVAIVVVSTSAEVESEGFDRTSLALPGRQDDLVRAVAAVNPRTIVVVNSGAPVLLPWRDQVAVVLATWFSGQEFGAALADVLSGDTEPGGRLPVTWPATEEQLPVSMVTPVNGRLHYDEGIHVGHRAWLRSGAEPAYPFGSGLGYTTWHLSSDAASLAVRAADDLTVDLQVENTGERAGKIVVQAYLERVSPSEIDRPVRWLAGFVTTELEAGTSAPVTVAIDGRRFAHWDGAWVTEPGEYRLSLGYSVIDLPLDIRVDVT